MMKIDPKFHYPLRALIALAIGIVIYQSIHTRFSAWILISIIMLLQSTTGATFKRASFRVFGTLFGVLIGMLLILLIPYNKPIYFAIVMVDLFFIYYWSRISYPITMVFLGMFVIVLLTIFFAGDNPDTAWQFAVDRVVDTLIGGTVVIVVSYFCWPLRTKDRVNEEIHQTIAVYQAAVEKTVSCFVAPYKDQGVDHDNDLALQEFYQKIKSLMVQTDDASQEPGELLPKIDIVQSIVCVLFRAYNHCVALQACLPLDEDNRAFFTNFSEPLNKLLASVHTLFSEFKTVLPSANGNTQLLAPEAIQENLFQIVSEIYKMEAEQSTYITSNPSGVKLTILFVNLRDLCIDLQYIFAGLKQLKKI